MSWDQIESKWAEMTRRVQSHWPDCTPGSLSGDDLSTNDAVSASDRVQHNHAAKETVGQQAAKLRATGSVFRRNPVVAAGVWKEMPQQALDASTRG